MENGCVSAASDAVNQENGYVSEASDDVNHVASQNRMAAPVVKGYVSEASGDMNRMAAPVGKGYRCPDLSWGTRNPEPKHKGS